VRRALATSLVTFAADTGAQIIAEGVETEGELEALRRIGIRYGQGFYLGHPGSIDALADVYTRQRKPQRAHRSIR
jgi:EAL domain-containing protein (putative c-di-GMP-specific phosphodiesterase class I)